MLKSETVIEKTAKSVNEAKEEALAELGISEAEAEIEIIDEGKGGLFGIGAKDAKVKVTVKEPVIYAAKRFLSQVFSDMGLEVEIDGSLEGDNLKIELSGGNMGIIIGKRGDTLDSLQYLTSLVVNKISEDYIKVTLDTENYREKRHTALLALADRLAKKVSRSGKKYTLEPMNPYERRIIHSALQENEDVTTFSVGEDPYRKVVIAPKNPVRPSYQKAPRYTPSSSLSSYPRPKKQPAYEDFESYFQDNNGSEDEE